MAGNQFFAYEDLTVSTTAVGFTAATVGSANFARVYVEGGAVRYRQAGTPTASSGEPLFDGDVIEFVNADEVARVLFISRDGSSITLRCHYGKRLVN